MCTNKEVTSTLAKGFICGGCVETNKGIAKPQEELSFFDQVELVQIFVIRGRW